jgi:hypothetical protein
MEYSDVGRKTGIVEIFLPTMFLPHCPLFPERGQEYDGQEYFHLQTTNPTHALRKHALGG